jgi:hypothetical protein
VVKRFKAAGKDKGLSDIKQIIKGGGKMKIRMMLVLAGMIFLALGTRAIAATKTAQPPLTQKDILTAQTHAALAKEWIVYLTPADIKGQKKGAATVETDVLTFTQGRVQSKLLSGLGFSDSNFSLEVGDDGTGVAETMQKNEAGDIAFIRAELKRGVLKGAISIRPVKGNKTVYNFSSVMPQATATTTTTTTTKKK